MEVNRKRFNAYVFISTFARNLIEVFIGTILFKAGFTLKSVIGYYLAIHIFSFILAFPCVQIAKKYTNKPLTIIGIIAFILVQVILNYIQFNHIYLIVLAFMFALYRRCYWISRRYYTLQVVDKKDTSKKYSFISIFNELALLISSYIGALLLEYVSINVITIITIILLIISLVCVFMLKFDHEINDTKINVLETIRITPISSFINMGCYEMQNVLKFLLPLYVVIYVKNTYTAIGIIDLITQLATIIFIYDYGKLINKDKNYLKFSIIFLVIAKILQVNTYGILLYIVTFISGLGKRMYEQSYHKELLTLSKNYEFHNFNLMYECSQNLFRALAVGIMYFFIKDIKIMIYFAIIILLIPLFFEFKKEVKTKRSKVVWKGN